MRGEAEPYVFKKNGNESRFEPKPVSGSWKPVIYEPYVCPKSESAGFDFRFDFQPVSRRRKRSSFPTASEVKNGSQPALSNIACFSAREQSSYAHAQHARTARTTATARGQRRTHHTRSLCIVNMVNDSHPRVWVDGKGMRRSLGAGHAAPHCGATANATLLPQGATPSPLGLGGKTKKKSKKKKEKKETRHQPQVSAAGSCPCQRPAYTQQVRRCA